MIGIWGAFGRVGRTVLFAFVLMQIATPARALVDCVVDFDDRFALNLLARGSAADTFAVDSTAIYDDGTLTEVTECENGPDDALCHYYYEFCGRGFFRVDALDYGHYHLGFEDPTLGECFGSNPANGLFAAGRLSGSTCVFPTNYAAEPRSLNTHDGNARIEIWQAGFEEFNEGGERCIFDFVSMRIMGDNPAEVKFYKENGQILTWSTLEPGFNYDFSAYGDDLVYVRVKTASGTIGSVKIDDIRVRG